MTLKSIRRHNYEESEENTIYDRLLVGQKKNYKFGHASS